MNPVPHPDDGTRETELADALRRALNLAEMMANRYQLDPFDDHSRYRTGPIVRTVVEAEARAITELWRVHDRESR